jgi:hypothetical protein
MQLYPIKLADEVYKWAMTVSKRLLSRENIYRIRYDVGIVLLLASGRGYLVSRRIREKSIGRDDCH